MNKKSKAKYNAVMAKKQYKKKNGKARSMAMSATASILIVLFILSTCLLLVLPLWLVLVINTCEMLIYGIVFRRVRISPVVFIIAGVIVIAMSVLFIIYGIRLVNMDLFTYRFVSIGFCVLVVAFIGFMVYVNWFDDDVDDPMVASTINLTGLLGIVGGWIIILLIIDFAGNLTILVLGCAAAIVHSALTWLIKCLRCGFARFPDEGGGGGGSSETYDIYIVKRDD